MQVKNLQARAGGASPGRLVRPPLDLDAFVRQHQVGTWRYLRYLGADAALAEELTQDALVRALEAGQANADARTAARWLRTTARHLWIDDRRRRLRHDRSRIRIDDLDAELVDSAWEATLRDDDGAGFREALGHCMAALPARSRQALELRYRDDAGRAGMARALDLSEAGVKQLLRRLRAGLRECIERRLGR